jgi:predicted TIM-barrel enzyme
LAFTHVADESLIQFSAAELLRYRKMIGADRVQVWAGVRKKHSSHAITADVSLGATVEAVELMRGAAVIVTGSVTGAAPIIADVQYDTISGPGRYQAHLRLWSARD